MVSLPNIIGTLDGWLRRRPKVRKRRIDRLEDITAHTFRLWLKESYGSYHMYVSEEETESGYNVINGVYILKSYLPKHAPEHLNLALGRVTE